MQIQNTELMSRLKEVFYDLVQPNYGITLTEEQKRILEERIDKYEQGKGKTYSWEEVLKEVRSR